MYRSPAQATAWHFRTFLPFGPFSGRGLPSLLTSFPENAPRSSSGMRTIPLFTQGTSGAQGQCFWFPNNLRPRWIHTLLQGIAGSQCVAARLPGQSSRAVCPGDKGSSVSPKKAAVPPADGWCMTRSLTPTGQLRLRPLPAPRLTISLIYVTSTQQVTLR